MRRQQPVLAAALLAVAAAGAAYGAGPENDKPVATAVTAVTVYEDRALVSRTATKAIQLPAGASVVKLGDFPAALSEASLRAMVEGAGVRVISVSTRTEQRAKAVKEEVRAAEKKVDTLERERLRLDAQRRGLDLQEAKVEEFAKLARRAIAERATMGEADVEGFRQADDLFTKRRADLDGKRREIDIALDTLDEKLKDARAQLGKISSVGMKTLRTVDVSLEAAKATQAEVAVSYIVRRCGWSPRYEARLVGGKLKVVYQGDVRQKTGEDWKRVRMTLSTARPALGAKRPDLPRLRMMTRKVAPAAKRGVSLRLFSRAGARAAAEAPAAPTPAAPETPADDVTARATDAGGSVLFRVPGKAVVPADNRSHRVPIVSFDDPAPKLGFETVPKLARSVYLRCDTSNGAEYPMLAGPVDIWRESGFIGTSRIPFTPPRGKIALSLGVDEDLKVRRDEQTYSVKKDGLIGSKRVHRFAFLIEVANYRKEPETVRVRENYPVSDIEEATVQLLSDTTEPTEHNKKDGLLMWELDIPPGEKRKVRLVYKVTVPKDFAWRP